MPTRGKARDRRTIKRKSAAKRLYGRRWRKWAKDGLIAEPLCRLCAANGLTVEATVRDHIIPHRGNLELFWQADNVQSLCKPCHDHKTLVEHQ